MNCIDDGLDEVSYDSCRKEKYPTDTDAIHDRQQNKYVPMKSSSIELPICPICNIILNVDVTNDQAINQHIDSCLNGRTVKQIICEEENRMHDQRKKRCISIMHCFDDAYHSRKQN